MFMKCLFIFNPKSGRGKVLKNEQFIANKLKTKYSIVDIYKTKEPKDAFNYVNKNYYLYDTIVVAGGDGTLNEIVNALAEKENAPTIGYIPTGTTNDLAHSLKISKNIKKALNIILQGNVFYHDIFKVNDKYGIYVCAAGFGTEVSYTTPQKKKKIWGKLAYFVDGVKNLFKSKPFNISIKFDDTTITKNCSLLLIVNSHYVSGFNMNKKAKLDDGLVDVVLIKSPFKSHLGLISLLSIVKIFLFGLSRRKKQIYTTTLQLKDFSISLNDKKMINIDGELGTQGEFNFKTIQKGIKIYCGKKRIDK